ncbi:MAG: Ni/Fe hydrogenase subunit alpha [Thermoplasmata archaeon]|nr:Ni/Fe hydrogenase subunit alpha [Thermoplasmata archaeon]
MAEREINIEDITKIEGHANLLIKIENDELKEVRLGVHEGKRFFEKFMVGRSYKKIPEMAGRICGICTVAHEIAAARAVENALSVKVPECVEMARNMMLISSHIQSHLLHLCFLALPDYVGKDNSLEMDVETLKKIYKVKEAANRMTEIIGGRAVHPCDVVVGGFSREIGREDAERYGKLIKEAMPILEEIASVFLTLDYPDIRRQNNFASLYGDEFSLYRGMIKTSKYVFEEGEYEKYIEERSIDYSNANRVFVRGEDFMVGALARLNFNEIDGRAKEMMNEHGIKFPSNNSCHMNIAQALEMVYFAEKAMEIADEFNGCSERGEVKNENGEGVAIIEAPRGLLLHHYVIEKGKVRYANIITPTAMNLESMERDLRWHVEKILNRDDEEIKKEAEKLIRAYDPCISCSVHVARVV